VLERSIRMRLAAAATALALAAPVWGTEIQVDKKKDPKETAGAQSSENKPNPAGEGEPATNEAKKKKKNCPIDNTFNTLEDLFGLVGPANPPAAASSQAGAEASAQTASAQPAAIEWRDVRPADEARPQEPTQPETTPEAKPDPKQD
jgi:hypothetical protein